MTQKAKAILAYIAVCIFWGSTYIAIRIGVRDLPPLLFASSRVVVPGVLMLAYAGIKGHKFPSTLKQTAQISLVGVLMLTGGTGLLIIAEQWIPAGVASIIVASIPLSMTVIEVVILKEKKIGIQGVIGLFVGFGGVIFLSFGSDEFSNISIKGVLILLIACMFWAVGSVYSKKINTQSSLTTSLGIQMTAGGIGNFIIGMVAGELPRFQLTFNASLSIIYLIIFGSLIGYSCYIYILKVWPIEKAGTYAYINPIVAVLFGALLLGEVITFRIILSLIIILAGVLIVQRAKEPA